MDYLHITVDDNALKQLSSLGLAHMGDCVYEIMTRSYLVLGGKTTAKSLHRATTELVRAQAQAKGAQKILPLLTEEELDIFHHGRNAKPRTVPKSCTLAEYAYATALETLFGWLYLKGQYDRLNELFACILEVLEA